MEAQTFAAHLLCLPSSRHKKKRNHQKPSPSPSPPSSNFPLHKSLLLSDSFSRFALLQSESGAMSSSHHTYLTLIHFPIAPFSIYHTSFSASAASHEHTLSSTFSALISSSSHQSPSGLTAATSDPSVHASLSHSLPLFPPHSSPCLSQFILPPGKQTDATALTPSGGWSGGGAGVVCTAKPFCSTAISKRGHRQCCCRSGRLKISPHLWFIGHRGQKQPFPETTLLSKRHIVVFFTCQCVKKSSFAFTFPLG